MTEIKISELDFASYKKQLKDYLKTQTTFKDYDFEGSNISVVLDVLAYNTYQNNYYKNMAISEMFLDSAQIYNSALSHAKSLNYLPKSRISSGTKISFNVNVNDDSPFIVIPRKTKFRSSSNTGKQYTFNTDYDTLVKKSTDGTFQVPCLDVYEGKFVDEFFISSGDIDQKIIISNTDIDIRSLKIYISDDKTNEVEYEFKTSVFGLKKEDRIFFLQCTNMHYEITFGQNVFGVNPTKNKIIRAEYRISLGKESNNISNLVVDGQINGYSVSSLELSYPTFGGTERESINSIKYYAPKSIQIQDRAITESDYVGLLRNNFPEIQSVSVVGGEMMTPPQYGRVGVYIDVFGLDGISQSQKENIKNFLKLRTPLAIDPVILSPEFMYVEVDTIVKYDRKITNKSQASIAGLTETAVLNFAESNLNDFGKTLYLSKLTSNIDDADESIIYNETRIRAIRELDVISGKKINSVLDFKTPIEKKLKTSSVKSTPFIYMNNTVFIQDNGDGILQIVKNNAGVITVIVKNVGKVNYDIGVIELKNVQIDSYVGVFRIFVSVSNNFIKSPANTIITIKKSDILMKVETE